MVLSQLSSFMREKKLEVKINGKSNTKAKRDCCEMGQDSNNSGSGGHGRRPGDLPYFNMGSQYFESMREILK